MSHSKRNTSLAFFTAHERAELRGTWGSQSTHLTRDSFLPFASCQLCLLPAREPVACAKGGHLFCRECAVSNLLAQNGELKRGRREAERRRVEDEVEEGERDGEAERRAVEEFEMVQAGLGVREGGKVGDRIIGRQAGKVIVEREEDPAGKPEGGGEGRGGGGGGIKRKFELDEQELRNLASSERESIKRRITSERNAPSSLPSFWVPGETPTNKKPSLKAEKPHPTCPAAEPGKPHEFTLKSLVAVRFTTESKNPKSAQQKQGEGEGEEKVRTCPACTKSLSNSTKAILAKPCGHVLCKACSERFQKAKEKTAHDEEEKEEEEGTVRCYVCQEDVTPGRRIKRKGKKDGGVREEKEGKTGGAGERGLVELSCEGTGFAGGGRNVVKKGGLSFQC